MAQNRSSEYRASAKDLAALMCALVLVAFGIININLLASANKTETSTENLPHVEGSISLSDSPKLETKTISKNNIKKSTAKSLKKSTDDKFDANTLLVISKNREALEGVGATAINNVTDTVFELKFSDEESANTAYETLKANSELSVIKSIPITVKEGEGSGTVDPFWGFKDVGFTYPSYWYNELAKTDKEVIVTVIDSGINPNHEVFKDANGNSRLIIDQYAIDYANEDNEPDDELGHGTAVAGIIAYATPDNVKIRPIKILSGESGNILHAYEAVAAIKGHTDIINMSIGEADPDTTSAEAIAELSRLDTTVIKPTRDAGAFIAGSSGNEGRSRAGFPSNGASVSAVSALDHDHTLADFSNYGTAIEYAMPGVDVFMADNETNDGYYYGDGTSFSSPMLAAAAAIAKLEDTTRTPNQIQAALNSYATPLTNPAGVNKYGNGMIDYINKKYNVPQLDGYFEHTDWTTANDSLSLVALTSGNIKKITLNDMSSENTTGNEVHIVNYTGERAVPITENGDYVFTVENFDGKTATKTFHEGHLDHADPSITAPLTVSDILDTSVKLNATITDADSGIAKVIIAGNDIDETATFTPSESNTVNFRYTLKNLTPQKDYTVKITAFDKVNHLASSANVSFRTLATSDVPVAPDVPSGDESDTSGTTPAPAGGNAVKPPKTEDPFFSYTSTFVVSGAIAYLVYYITTRRR